jgi:hypothetical protein
MVLDSWLVWFALKLAPYPNPGMAPESQGEPITPLLVALAVEKGLFLCFPGGFFGAGRLVARRGIPHDGCPFLAFLVLGW